MKILKFFAVALASVSISHAALADGGAKFLGNITTGGQIRSDMGTYWNQITSENGCKWGSIHTLSNGNSGTSKFAWDNYDKCEGAYKWAKEKPGRHFKFHALVWGSQYPSFLCKAKNPSITVEKTKQYITEWFDAVAAKFPDLEYIDVVNEAIYAGNNYHSGYQLPATGAEGVSTDDKSCGGSYIIEALGGDRIVNGKHQYDFITTAFKMARERWPKAVLIYNDYNTLKWQKNEGIELVQTILKNGAPVDAYGQQAHDAADFPTAEAFSKVLTEVHNAVGIPLFITEYDVGADDNTQKNIISNQIPFLWETPWIAGITIWGYINGSTWRQNTGIMNSNGTDRPAMTWLKQYFAQNLSKGQNTTGLGGAEGVVTVPQAPFGGKALSLGGRLEFENYDVGGSGVAYYHPGTIKAGDYREDDVGVVGGGTGKAIGNTSPEEWLEYTVNVATAGEYELTVNAASGLTSYSLQFFSNGKAITDNVKINVAEADRDWSTYVEQSFGKVKLAAGEQVIKVVINGYVNLDYVDIIEYTEPQTPFGGKAWAIPGKIEAENFDVPGVGTGNDSYSDSDAGNNGDSDYRKGTDVDIKKGATGNVIGWSAEGEWLEYSVDVKTTGTYTMFAAVASANGSSFKLSIDGKDVTETVKVPKAVAGEENYDDYNKVEATVKLTAGKHILRLTVVDPWFDIDYITFVSGENAKDPEPIVKEESSSSSEVNPGSSDSKESSSSEVNPGSSDSKESSSSEVNPGSSDSKESSSSEVNSGSSDSEHSSSSEGDAESSDAPVSGDESSDETGFVKPLQFNVHNQTYRVFSVNGNMLGSVKVTGTSVKDALNAAGYNSGVYILRNRNHSLLVNTKR